MALVYPDDYPTYDDENYYEYEDDGQPSECEDGKTLYNWLYTFQNCGGEDDGQPSEYEEWQDVFGGDVEEYGTFGCYDNE